MHNLIRETMIQMCNIRDIIEENPEIGEKLGLDHFVNEPEVMSDIISELYHAQAMESK